MLWEVLAHPMAHELSINVMPISNFYAFGNIVAARNILKSSFIGVEARPRKDKRGRELELYALRADHEIGTLFLMHEVRSPPRALQTMTPKNDVGCAVAPSLSSSAARAVLGAERAHTVSVAKTAKMRVFLSMIPPVNLSVYTDRIAVPNL